LILQSLEELESDLRNHGVRPIYLILGPEIYLCHWAINTLKSKALTPESLAFDYSDFSAGEVSVDQIIEAANIFPMMSRKRMVLISEAEKLKDAEQESLLNALDTISPRSMLVLFAEDLDHRKKFYKVLRDKYCVAEFPKLKDAALEKWAASFIQQQGYRSSPAAIRKITELAGSDLQTMVGELEKLVLFAGKDKSIPDSAVEDLISASREQSIFELINAVGRRDRNGALRSLANLLSMGEYPLVIVTMLARHCRQVLIAKDCLNRGISVREIGSAAQIPPFLLDQFLRQARAVDSITIQNMFIRLAETDRKLKSTSADGRLLLESLICTYV
jgi:DNA polymerase III subunit delta